MMIGKIRAIDLQRFGEAAGDGGDAGVNGSDAGSQGSNSAAPSGQAVSFKEFLKQNPQYKQEYDGAIRNAVTSRVSGMKTQIEAYQRITDLLAARHEMDLDQNGGYDLAKLYELIEGDRSSMNESALEHGNTPEQEDQRRRDSMQLKRYQANEAKAQKAEADRQKAAQLHQEAQAMAAKYPGFNMDAEMQNQEFAKMVLMDGMPVEKAYKFVHMDDMLQDAMRYSAGKTADAVTASVAAGKARPVEGAARSNSAGVSTKRSFTAADIEKVKKDMARGRSVVF